VPGFLSDDELRSRFEIIHKADDGHVLGEWWTPHIPDCNAQAWSFIAGTLGERGYTLADILRWGKAGKSYQSQVALYLLNERGRLDVGLPSGEVQQDPRPALTDVGPNGRPNLALTDDDGNLIVPAAAALVLHGKVNSEGETFRDRRGCWKKW
jgi:hypothetical protein